SWDFFAELVIQTDSNNAIREHARSAAYAAQNLSANRSHPSGSRGGDNASSSHSIPSSTQPNQDLHPHSTPSQRNDRSTNTLNISSSAPSQQSHLQAHLAHPESHEPDPDIDPIEDSNITPDVTNDIPESIEEESFQGYATVPPEAPLGWLYTLAAKSPSVFSTFVRDYQGILDSGSSKHLFNQKQIFWNFNPKAVLSIGTANCGSLETHGKGLVKIRVTNVKFPDKSFIITLEDAHYAPDCPVNLFSFGTFLESGMRMYYEGNEG
ncbi:hypothetical protein VNI00_018508, partial [Paramarasmius palmivorus]